MRWICRRVCWRNPGIAYFRCSNLSDRWAAPESKVCWKLGPQSGVENSLTHFVHPFPKFYRGGGVKSANFGLNFQPRSPFICSSFETNQYGWNLKQKNLSSNYSPLSYKNWRAADRPPTITTRICPPRWYPYRWSGSWTILVLCLAYDENGSAGHYNVNDVISDKSQLKGNI